MNNDDITDTTPIKKQKTIVVFKNNIPMIKAMIAEGYTQRAISDSMGIKYSTFKSYMNQFKSDIEMASASESTGQPEAQISHAKNRLPLNEAKNTNQPIQRNNIITDTDSKQQDEVTVDFDTLMDAKAREQVNSAYFQARPLGKKTGKS